MHTRNAIRVSLLGGVTTGQLPMGGSGPTKRSWLRPAAVGTGSSQSAMRTKMGDYLLGQCIYNFMLVYLYSLVEWHVARMGGDRRVGHGGDGRACLRARQCVPAVLLHAAGSLGDIAAFLKLGM